MSSQKKALLERWARRRWSPSGLVTAMVVILMLIYCCIVGWLPMAVNMATMIFLTVAAGTRILGGGEFLPLFVSLGLGLVWLTGLCSGASFTGRPAYDAR